MEFFEAVEKRQSIRKYVARAVETEKLERILHATNRAPSAGNYQAFEIYVVSGRGDAVALTCFDQPFVAQAPVVLVFCANPAREQYEPKAHWALVDATIACTFAMLAAQAEGLGTCWIGAFDPGKLAQLVACPHGVTPVALLCVGYADEQPERTTRRPLESVVQHV